MIGKFVIVRTYSAGVHYGTVEMHEGKEVVLKDARRLWKWSGALSLSDIAANGLNENGSKISEKVDSIFLSEAIELILVKPAIKKMLMGAKTHAV